MQDEDIPIVSYSEEPLRQRRFPAVFFIPTEPVVFPGHKGGNSFVENLSSYMEDVVYDRSGRLIRTSLQFDINRYTKWDKNYNLAPFRYETRITGFYPVARFPF